MTVPPTKAEIFKEASDHGWVLLHGGAAMVGKKLFLFPAASGNGKSTFLARLAISGIPCSDEYILMKRVREKLVFRVFGMPFSLSPQTLSVLQIDYPGCLEGGPSGLTTVTIGAFEKDDDEIDHEKNDSDKILYEPPQPLVYEGPGHGIVFVEPDKRALSSDKDSLEHGLTAINASKAGELLLTSVVRHIDSRSPNHVASRKEGWFCLNHILDNMQIYKVVVPWFGDTLAVTQKFMAEIVNI